jgi:pyruvate dehydrogenase E2 component (dihydrolipoamide acetyltransferase)
MSEIVMPRLSDTMEEGTILRWLKRDGEHVRRGEELVEIETDKAAMVYESDQEGALRIVAQEGDTLAVGATIAQVGEAGTAETPSTESPAPAAVASRQESAPTDAAVHESADPQLPPADTAVHQSGSRVKASPLARRIAKQSGVDLHALAGTGPGGRIVKADVEAAEPPRSSSAWQAPRATPPSWS